jgi:hypothetical protein
LEPRLNRLRRPRRWACLAATAMVVVAAWLLFVPISAVYVTSDISSVDHLPPHDVSTLYTWWTSDESLVYSDAGLTETHVVKGVRLDCGNTFTAGSHEQQQQPDGPLVCAGVETARRIIGLSLITLGVLGLLGAVKLPIEPERYRNQYRQPYRQRRLLKRGR